MCSRVWSGTYCNCSGVVRHSIVLVVRGRIEWSELSVGGCEVTGEVLAILVASIRCCVVIKVVDLNGF